MTPPLRATYRLQLTAQFGFDRARELVPYLKRLGVSHLYLSPALQARPGSPHGYDVLDPTRVSDELGGEEGLRRLSDAAAEAGMGLVLDIVPNHMAADDGNRFWADPQLRERFFDLDRESGRWRRFFDIDELAAVRQEDPEVFEQTHARALSLLRDGVLDGLRIDHVDGLSDPAGYLARLRDAGAERVWVEKILEPGERLRPWPVCGTTGYEFLADACAVFVDPAGEEPLSALWLQIAGDPREFEAVAHDAKLEQVRTTFTPELERLERLHPGVAREELCEGLAALPVYRTYVDPATGRVEEQDRQAASSLPEQLAHRLLLEERVSPELVTRFQQTTPAVMAKGVEDTALYRYGRLLALNDVGSDPGRFSIEIERFHDANLERARDWPRQLLATMTHDAKRSADVRMRIAMLASMPDEWSAFVHRALELTRPLVGARGAPDDVERYFLLQTLVGAWPIEPERLGEYAIKALREAKRNTNWVDPDEDWEHEVSDFCAGLYASAELVAELERFVDRLAGAGARASIVQQALKLTVPGIPDIYQGDELELRTLVDPDNRRPVDWERRRAALRDGSSRKLSATERLLALRARRPELFSGYEPLEAGAEVCAFTRGGGLLVAAAVRGLARPASERNGALMRGTRGRWREVLTGAEREFGHSERVADVLAGADVAVYERIRGAGA